MDDVVGEDRYYESKDSELDGFLRLALVRSVSFNRSERIPESSYDDHDHGDGPHE